MKLKRNKKIYYLPGLISLLVIPIYFVYQSQQIIKNTDYWVVGFNMPPKDYFEKYPESEYRNFPSEEIVVPADFDENTFDEFKQKIFQFQSDKSQNKFLSFSLNDENTYDDFIKLNNLMLLTDSEVYSFDYDRNSFDVVVFEEKSGGEVIEPIACGGVFYIPREEVRKSNFFHQNWENIKNLPKPMLPVVFGYLFLVTSAVFKWKIRISF